MGSHTSSGEGLVISFEGKLASLQFQDDSSARTEFSSLNLWTLDFILKLTDLSTSDVSSPVELSGDKFQSRHFDLLREGFNALKSSDVTRVVIIRFFFSSKDGQVAKSDFLERRFEGCEIVRASRSFLSPLSHAAAVASFKDNVEAQALSGLQVVPQTMGGLLLEAVAVEGIGALLQRLNQEIDTRLSFPWLLETHVERRRVFWVQGREDFESSRRAYEAAIALGLTLVVLDHAGHWLEDDNGPHAHVREAFIPTNIDVDEGFSQRIVDAVKNYPHPVDGITTISDLRLAGVARACEMLGLPTAPSSAYATAGDKAVTRRLEDEGSGESFRVTKPSDLDAIIAERRTKLQYPLIVKPCTGWNSDCVTKVVDEASLYAAVRKASERHAHSPNRSTGVVVEPYIDGPEVDANFVILDGEILFYDITDDFPCTADVAGKDDAANANFMETLMLVPSGLPDDEKAMMRESLKKSILRQGFPSGIFHCEARVRGSRAAYRARDDNGLLDLHAPPVSSGDETASCYLHEINARPPGYLNTVGVLLAYGVDYYAIRLLLALGSEGHERVKALSQPFKGGKPQYTLGVTILPARRSGIMETEDAVVEMMDRHPWLRDYIVDYKTCKKRGDVVQGPESPELWWVAYVTVASRVGRGDCLEKVQFVRDHFTYKLADE
ncbi:ATP-grasp superfamily protein [Colletotrichum plurivorum]|uniref:ATP-grasp superfamily protein n=1 Tax=Colletotrichum plurivorum TaxID=2175906 RepID=A0A8H6JKW2_9PEZI|nr:ATP-grasp superfamily protein [Colletotrichum plurivorum]